MRSLPIAASAAFAAVQARPPEPTAESAELAGPAVVKAAIRRDFRRLSLPRIVADQARFVG